MRAPAAAGVKFRFTLLSYGVMQGFGGSGFVAIRAVEPCHRRGLLLRWLGSPGPAGGARARGLDRYPVATDSRLGGDDNQVRFVVDLTHKIDLRAFTLADPYRVVIDIPQVTFKLPSRAGETGRGLVKAYRFGLVMQGGSRIVLDLTKPVRIDKAFVLDAAEGQPARMVLDLVAIDRDTFMRALALDSQAAAARSARKFERDPARQGRSAAHHRARSGPRRHRPRHPGRGRRTSRKRPWCWNLRCCCATSSKKPANTAW